MWDEREREVPENCPPAAEDRGAEAGEVCGVTFRHFQISYFEATQ